MKRKIIFLLLFFTYYLNFGQTKTPEKTNNDNLTAVFENLKIDKSQGVISIYPNPVKTILKIDSKIEVTSVEVYNSLGSLVFETDKTEINVSSLNSGMYLMKAKTLNAVFVKKIFKD